MCIQLLRNIARRNFGKMSIRRVGLVEKWDTNLLHRIRRFVDFAANSVPMDKVST